jgi:hypothetical protein
MVFTLYEPNSIFTSAIGKDDSSQGKKFVEISDEILEINDFLCGTRKLNLVQKICLNLNKIIFVMVLV